VDIEKKKETGKHDSIVRKKTKKKKTKKIYILHPVSSS